MFVLASAAIADIPKKIPRSRYSSLVSNSPFTSKPPPGEVIAAENPLTDYVLLGVSSVGELNKYRVTMVNKKTPDAERIYLDSDSPPRPPDNFKIVRVNRTPGDPMGTTVTVSSGATGAMTGTIAYDEKLLTIAATKPPAQPNNGQPNNGQPGQPNLPGQPPNPNAMNRPGGPGNQPGAPGGNNQVRPPRQRVIPPPTAAGGTPNPTVNGAAVQPPVPVQPQSNTQGQGNERPSRHRNY